MRHSSARDRLGLLLALSIAIGSAASCRDSNMPGPGTPGLVCENTCKSAYDGECDDGGEASDYDECDLGSDCDDCGPRTILQDGGPDGAAATDGAP